MDYTENIILLLRNQRNQLLSASDKYVLPDYPIVSSNLELVKVYRQQLRDYMGLESNYNSSCNRARRDEER